MGQSMVKPGAASMTGVQSGVHRRVSRAGSLLTYPDPALERPSFDVDTSDPEVIEIAAALVGTLRGTPGCWGLSAPQLGYHGRILCVDVTNHPEARTIAGLILLANPEILSISGHAAMREECTSHPHVTADLTRASTIVIRGTVPGRDRNVVIMANGAEARCLLHEMDHLDGISMLDRVITPTAIHREGGSQRG
jgi:peptide deformylase